MLSSLEVLFCRRGFGNWHLHHVSNWFCTQKVEWWSQPSWASGRLCVHTGIAHILSMFLEVFGCLFHTLSRISSKEQNEMNEHAFGGIERESRHRLRLMVASR